MESPAANEILKGIEEIYGRLFNHRPVVSAEVNLFLKEFEEQRNDREVERLCKILVKATEIRESQLDKIRNFGDVHLPSLGADLAVALTMCNRIHDNEQKFNEENCLAEQRKLRENVWTTFSHNIKDKFANVEETFKDKEARLLKHYKEMEEKLMVG